MFELKMLPEIITAIGGLGTAAFGLVDASKALFWGGVNHIGFSGIRRTVKSLTPATNSNALSQSKIVATLQANWFNGTDLNSQKAIAKSLIKLNLSVGNAKALAAASGVDAVMLESIADGIAKGTTLTPAQSDVYARFDMILTALLDETYQRSDNQFRNWTRATAAIVAVALAMIGGRTIGVALADSALIGLLATPFAPIAKDLSTALATAVNTMQLVKK